MSAQPSIAIIVVSAILTENVILTRFLGIGPLLGTSRRLEAAVGVSLAVVLVLVLSTALTWLVWTYLLVPVALGFLRTILFILVVAASALLVDTAIAVAARSPGRAPGIFLPLVTTNCVVLGVCLLNADRGYGLLASLVSGVSSGAGFGLALVIFSGLRERIHLARVPRAMQGPPIALIMAGLLSLAFMGFARIVVVG